MSGPINPNVSGDTPSVPNASYSSGSVSVGTTATLIAVVPEGYTGVALVSSSAAAFIGGPGVTTTTGFPVAANTPVQVPSGKGNARALYAVVASGTATVSYLIGAD